MLTALTIKNCHSNVLIFLRGDPQSTATRCDTPSNASSVSLVFITDAEQLAQVALKDPAILVIHSKLAGTVGPDTHSKSCIFLVDSISIGMVTLLKYFDRKRARFSQWGERHATAVVHTEAHIGDGALLGPYCVIGAHAVIGAGSVVGAHSVIENDVQIGARCIIHPHVFIGAGCQIGDDCEIHPHTSVGSDGFGYAMDANGQPQKIPHLGNVVIGDHVEIGSNCAIDRATLTSTYIRSGTKLDNICHIAHNCDLGENGLFAAGFMMGGSTKIGRQFATGGNSVVTAHVTLGDNVTLAGRSTVTKDVSAAGVYGGYPLQPLPEAMKTLVNIGRLNEMGKDLHRVMKYLDLAHKKDKKTSETHS